jgi:hypothetical protein
VDLGTDGWTGNSGTDAAAGGATASVTAVTVNSNNAINGPQLTLTVTVNATVAGTFGVGTLTMGTSVQDNAGNSTSGHNVWTYNPGRVNPQLGTVDPGWDRN